jgi:ABC-2 type transport system ATP-binding protein
VTPAVRTAGLTRVFVSDWKRERRTAVDRLDLEVAEGEIYGFLGPNGAGKTTTLKLLLGLLRPTAGSAEVLGCPAGGIAHRARLGYLPENPYFYDYLTSSEFLRFAASLSGRARPTDGEIEALLRRVGLAHAPALALRKFSKGMLQRIGVAQALVGDPAILILDEATSSVDTRTEVAIQAALRRILSGRTALIIAHRLSTIRDADRIVVVDAGRVVEDGTYADLIAGDGPFAALHRAQFNAG